MTFYFKYLEELKDFLKKGIQKKTFVNNILISDLELNDFIANKSVSENIFVAYSEIITDYAQILGENVYFFENSFFDDLINFGEEKMFSFYKDFKQKKYNSLIIPIFKLNFIEIIFVDMNDRIIEFYEMNNYIFSDDKYRLKKFIESITNENNIEFKIKENKEFKNLDKKKYLIISFLLARVRIFGKNISFILDFIENYRYIIAHEIIESKILYFPEHQFL